MFLHCMRPQSGNRGSPSSIIVPHHAPTAQDTTRGMLGADDQALVPWLYGLHKHCLLRPSMAVTDVVEFRNIIHVQVDRC